MAYPARLGRWFRGKNVLINVLQYNETKCGKIQRPNKQQLVAFKARLEEAGLEVKLRESRGNNIKAACGQLVSEHNKKSIDELSNVNLHNGRSSHSITGKRPITNKQRNSFEGKPQKRHPFAKRKKKMSKKK